MPKADRQPLPLGYSLLALPEGKGTVIIVPTKLYYSIEAERHQEGLRASSPTAAAAPVQSPAPPPSERPEAPQARRSYPGQEVPVITYREIAVRRANIDTRFRFSTEEKKAEMRTLDALFERGEKRVVGLRFQWRRRIAQLRVQMPHLARVIDRIEACCALADFTLQPLRIPPLLLVGPPGVGKTHFAMAVADLLGAPNFVYSLDSAEAVSTLTGSEKYWGNSEPGQLFTLIMQGDFANPVIVLDELDKARSGGSGYRPANALHAVLEPVTSKQFRDKSVDIVFDASYVVYIATANRLSDINPSLVSRFELFLIDEPGPREAVALARAIGRQVVAELNLTWCFEAPTGEVLQQLALTGTPRQMHKLLVAAIGRAIVEGRRRLVVEDLLANSGQRSFQDLDHGSLH